MKILTKEEEQAHYNETLKGGISGGIAGLALGGLGVYGAAARFPAFRSLTVPLRAFLITSSGTFAGKLEFLVVMRILGWNWKEKKRKIG
ncbi:MAG: hypothetical protein L6R42_010877, partial [Xanthoria sp. 1 TBL-2021]